jgi:hypothetical protein
MKKTILTGVFIFSLALNLAVAGTLVWHVWFDRRPDWFADQGRYSLTQKDWEEIRRLGMKNGPPRMGEHRQKIIEKRSEILDLVAKNPTNLAVADKAVEELIALRGEQEKRAVERLGRIMASIPEEKREAFLRFLKNRTCMGRGMGWGFGRGHHGGGRGGPGPYWMKTP